jgi:hypothetical protein
MFAVSLACSSPAAAPKGPTVDSITVGVITKDASGKYAGVITVAAHGDGSTVSSLAIHVPPQQNGVTIADGNAIGVVGVVSPYPINLTFPVGMPAGTYTFQVTAIDGAGVRSAALGSSFVLP